MSLQEKLPDAGQSFFQRGRQAVRKKKAAEFIRNREIFSQTICFQQCRIFLPGKAQRQMDTWINRILKTAAVRSMGRKIPGTGMLPFSIPGIFYVYGCFMRVRNSPYSIFNFFTSSRGSPAYSAIFSSVSIPSASIRITVIFFSSHASNCCSF